MIELLQSLSVQELIVSILDIVVVAFLFYRFLLLIRGTRAVQLIKGIVVLVIAFAVSRWLDLRTIGWLLDKAGLALFVTIPIVFQPELRRALEQLGRGKLFVRSTAYLNPEDLNKLIEEIVGAVGQLSRDRTGALIVLERETGLAEIVETGIQVDGLVTREFLINIFVPRTPLHDGAVIISGKRIAAAGCFLPLTDAPGLDTEFGSRHRAALGITEHSDALAIVVSEETGTISLANDGKLMRHLDNDTLGQLLKKLIKTEEESAPSFWQWRHPEGR